MKNLRACFDGSCNPNPNGIMGIGWVLYEDEKEIDCYSKTILPKRGNSNNLAEYLALQNLLEKHTEPMVVQGDSKLVIYQMKRLWGINGGSYSEIARKLRSYENKHEFRLIPRAANTRADELSKPSRPSNEIIGEMRINFGSKRGTRFSKLKLPHAQWLIEKTNMLPDYVENYLKHRILTEK